MLPSPASGTLVILGSGEIAPSMVKVYRDVLEGIQPRRGVMLDTPFGFQENVPQLTAKIVEYFRSSLQFELEPASLVRLEGTSDLARASFLDAVRRARFVFAGPGSPSYALKQWAPLAFTDALAGVLADGGVVSFSSAAALTLGHRTAPIYELYKVGDAPYWLDGLGLLDRFGLRCAVIPHFDNAEGQNHDTRFCYLGERRLRMLESMLDDDVATLGVDEHTAVVIDLAADAATVRGRGRAYWRTGAGQRTIATGERVALDELRNAPFAPRAAADPSGPDNAAAGSDARALGEVVAGGGEAGLRALAELVRLAGSGGRGRIDPAPLVEGVLAARADARAAGQYQLADELRDALVAAGIEVHDAPGGATWSLREP
jgi:hypothetical protein